MSRYTITIVNQRFEVWRDFGLPTAECIASVSDKIDEVSFRGFLNLFSTTPYEKRDDDDPS